MQGWSKRTAQYNTSPSIWARASTTPRITQRSFWKWPRRLWCTRLSTRKVTSWWVCHCPKYGFIPAKYPRSTTSRRWSPPLRRYFRRFKKSRNRRLGLRSILAPWLKAKPTVKLRKSLKRIRSWRHFKSRFVRALTQSTCSLQSMRRIVGTSTVTAWPLPFTWITMSTELWSRRIRKIKAKLINKRLMKSRVMLPGLSGSFHKPSKYRKGMSKYENAECHLIILKIKYRKLSKRKKSWQ